MEGDAKIRAKEIVGCNVTGIGESMVGQGTNVHWTSCRNRKVREEGM